MIDYYLPETFLKTKNGKATSKKLTPQDANTVIENLLVLLVSLPLIETVESQSGY